MTGDAMANAVGGRRIAVTGAGGFIGSHLCRRLVAIGAEVHGISRSGPRADVGIRWWQGDLAEIDDVREMIRAIEPHAIFHLASHVAGARDLRMVVPTFRGNLATTVNLLTCAAEIGCERVILAGSMEEPGADDPEPVPSSPYAAAKWSSSAYARMFYALYHLPVVILRIFMVYGPAQRDLRKLIPYVTVSLLTGRDLELTSGRREVDWIYVDDVVDAFVAAAAGKGLEGLTIDVGSGELVSVRRVVERLVDLVDPAREPTFGTLDDRPLETVTVADVARTRALIGWHPTTPLDTGLRRTVSWYEETLREGSLETT